MTALGLATVVVGFAFTSFSLAARTATAWQRDVALTNAFHVAAQQIATDLGRARRLTPHGEAQWLLPSATGAVRYRLHEGTLERNGHRLHPSTMTASLTLGDTPEAPPSYTGTFSLTDGRRTLSTRLAVVPRAASPWPDPTEPIVPESPLAP